jgi:hypothetical protein
MFNKDLKRVTINKCAHPPLGEIKVLLSNVENF